MTTYALVGAGPGLGLATARRFGTAGHDVALIARSAEHLALLTDDLRRDGIEARGFAADVLDPAALAAALHDAAETLGPIEILQYSPVPRADFMKPVLDTTVDDLDDPLAFSVRCCRRPRRHRRIRPRHGGQQLADEGHRVLALTCDVTDESQVAAAVDRTVDTFGRLDMAYNNAGIQIPPADAAEEAVEVFDRVHAINLRGVWASMKHELRHMRAQGSGAIVNCSSLGGLVGIPGRASYHASKHGVIGLTGSAALEYAPRGIRINAICPGTIDTPMVSDMIAKGELDRAEAEANQPINRLGTADEIGQAVLWLCSPGASFVVGVALPVDGGYVAQ